MKRNICIFSAIVGFGLSLKAAPDATPALFCKGQSIESIQNFVADNNTFLLKLGFGELDRTFYVQSRDIKMSSKIPNGSWMDHVDLMKKYRRNKFTYNQMSANQLDRNIKSYEIVKTIKELGLYLASLTLPCVDEAGHQEKLADLTTYLTAMKPLDISEAVEEKIKRNLGLDFKKASEEKPEEVDQITQEQLKIAISSHTKHVVELMMQSLFGNDPVADDLVATKKTVSRQLVKLVTPMIQLMYMDHQIGRTQWLGRALIALQLRQGNDQAFDTLKQYLYASGITLENIVGKTWLMDDQISNIAEAQDHLVAVLSKLRNEKRLSLPQALAIKNRFDQSLQTWLQKKTDAKKAGFTDALDKTITFLKNQKFAKEDIKQKIASSLTSITQRIKKGPVSFKTNKVAIPVHTMSYLLTRNINVESALTPSLALPGNYEIGKQFHLIGSLASAMNVVDADYVADNGFGLVTQLKDRAFYRTLNNGFSHVGFAAVREADGVTMTWVIDNYPTPVADNEIDLPGTRFNAGGVRWVGLEQFYKPSQHTRIAVITPDAKLFHEYAKPQIENRLKAIAAGQEILGTKMYNAVHPNLDSTGKPMRNLGTNIDDPWTMEIDSATFKKIHQYENDEEWFDSVSAAAMDKIVDFMYQGVSFVWITPYGQYYKGGAYCSFTGVLGWNLGAGIEALSTHKDSWSTVIKGLALIHEKAVKKLSALENSKIDDKQKVFLKKQLQAVVDNGSLKDAAVAVSVDIYTPSGLPAQTYVPKKNVYEVVAPYRDVNARYGLLFDKNQKAFEEYRIMEHKSVEYSANLNEISLDPTEVRGIQLDLLEVSDVKNASSHR